MVVKAAKNRYYHFSLNCGQIIEKRPKSTRYSAFSAVFIFLEHFLFLEWSTSLVRTRSRVQIPLTAPKKTTKYGGFFLYLIQNKVFQGRSHRYNCIQSGTIANFLSVKRKVELFLDCLSVRNALKRPDSALFA